jgi:Holliday junction resolvasome RuvABC endonuclease subunit
MSKFLALDQSSRITGYAVFENAKLIDYGKFSVNDEDIGVRLMKIRQEVEHLIKQHEVEEVVFEDIQLQSNVANNVQTFKALAEVFGVIYELVTELNLPNTAILASSWKSTL